MNVHNHIAHIMCIICIRHSVNLDLSVCWCSTVMNSLIVPFVCPCWMCAVLVRITFLFKLSRALNGKLVMLYTYHKPHRLKDCGNFRLLLHFLTTSCIFNPHQTGSVNLDIWEFDCPRSDGSWKEAKCRMQESDILCLDTSDVIFVFLKFSYIKIIIIFHVLLIVLYGTQVLQVCHLC